jgi:hypothetical protein
VNKWFKKQYRTDADARLDEEEPGRYEPPPVDEDTDSDGKAVTVAPPTRRAQQEGAIQGGNRPLKGGYWFIREKFRNEVTEAVARDKERTEQSQHEREEDERTRQVSRMHSRHASPGLQQPPQHRSQGVDPPPQGYMYTADRTRGTGSGYGRNTGARHHMGYPPPRS